MLERNSEFRFVKNWLRASEDKFLNALMNYGNEVMLGRGVWIKNGFRRNERGDFTFRGLCDVASSAILVAARMNFGPLLTFYPVSGNPQITDPEGHNFYFDKHVWLRYRETSTGDEFFIDPTAKQIRPQLPGVILTGSVEHEEDFFNYLGKPQVYNARAIHSQHYKGDFDFPLQQYSDLIQAMLLPETAQSHAKQAISAI